MTEMQPLYRAGAETIFIGKTLCRPGATAVWSGWPSKEMRGVQPVNEPARKIYDWYVRHVDHGPIPASPYSNKHARYLLPAVLDLPVAPVGDQLPTFVAPVVEMPGMPRWRSWTDVRSGARVVPRGQEFIFLGWPASVFLDASNAPAEEVQAYWRYALHHPAREPAPWDEFSDSLFMPQLAPLKAPRIVEPTGFKPEAVRHSRRPGHRQFEA
jgi:hypothetical protein